MPPRIKYTDSKTRVFVSIISNILTMALRFFGNIFIARGLGPFHYGQLNFSLSSTLGLMQLFDFGTTQAFFTFISHKERPAGIYYWNFIWLLIQFLFISGLILLVINIGYMDSFWLGIPGAVIIMALIASFLRDRVWTTINNIAEAGRKTVAIQYRNIGIACAHLLLLIVLYVTGMLNIISVLLLIQVEIILGIVSSFNVVKGEIKSQTAWRAPFNTIFCQLKVYCTPLLIYSIVGGGVEFLDRWLLQKFGGSIEQGFYSMSYILGSSIMLIPSAMLKVHWKEVAESSRTGNSLLAFQYYKVGCHLAFISSSLMVGFMIPWSRTILSLLAGSAYSEGASVLTVMMFFYIYLSFGQITGTTLYAISQTRLLSTIGITVMLLGLIATYFLVGPQGGIIPGFHLGGMGLAVKLLFVAFVTTNLQNIFICRTQGWPIEWRYQPRILAIVMLLGFLSSYVSKSIMGDPRIPAMLVSLVLYLLMTWWLFTTWPGIFGVTKDEMKRYKKHFVFWKGQSE